MLVSDVREKNNINFAVCLRHYHLRDNVGYMIKHCAICHGCISDVGRLLKKELLLKRPPERTFKNRTRNILKKRYFVCKGCITKRKHLLVYRRKELYEENPNSDRCANSTVFSRFRCMDLELYGNVDIEHNKRQRELDDIHKQPRD